MCFHHYCPNPNDGDWHGSQRLRLMYLSRLRLHSDFFGDNQLIFLLVVLLTWSSFHSDFGDAYRHLCLCCLHFSHFSLHPIVSSSYRTLRLCVVFPSWLCNYLGDNYRGRQCICGWSTGRKSKYSPDGNTFNNHAFECFYSRFSSLIYFYSIIATNYQSTIVVFSSIIATNNQSAHNNSLGPNQWRLWSGFSDRLELYGSHWLAVC